MRGKYRFYFSWKKQTIEEWKSLTNQFDASFVLEEAKGRKPADVIIEVARRLQVTQILLGQSARTRWEEIRKGSIVNEIMRQTKYIDIHIVADQEGKIEPTFWGSILIFVQHENLAFSLHIRLQVKHNCA